MNKPQLPPRRTRQIYLTMELCLNRNAGPYGSVELISSYRHKNDPTFDMWPLGEHGMLTALQVSDLAAVVGALVSETIVTQLHVQAEIPGLLVD